MFLRWFKSPNSNSVAPLQADSVSASQSTQPVVNEEKSLSNTQQHHPAAELPSNSLSIVIGALNQRYGVNRVDDIGIDSNTESKACDLQKKYAWDLLLSGSLDVLICAVIIVANRVFGEQIQAANDETAKIIDGLETGAILNLIGVCYGILNNQVSSHTSIEYFTVGHTAFHRRLIPSDNLVLNGFVWGIHGTWRLSALAGFLQGALAVALNFTRPAMSYMPFAVATAGYSALTFLGAYFYSNSDKRRSHWKQFDLKNLFSQTIYTKIKEGEDVDLTKIPENKYLGYLNCSDRSDIGHIALPVAAVSEIIAYGVVRGIR